MTKFIIGAIAVFAAWIYIGTPAGQAELAALAARLQAVPAASSPVVAPGASDEDLPPPPVSAETVPAVPGAPAQDTAAAAAPAAEAGPEDTFINVMGVYEADDRARAAEGGK